MAECLNCFKFLSVPYFFKVIVESCFHRNYCWFCFTLAANDSRRLPAALRGAFVVNLPLWSIVVPSTGIVLSPQSALFRQCFLVPDKVIIILTISVSNHRCTRVPTYPGRNGGFHHLMQSLELSSIETLKLTFVPLRMTHSLLVNWLAWFSGKSKNDRANFLLLSRKVLYRPRV